MIKKNKNDKLTINIRKGNCDIADNLIASKTFQKGEFESADAWLLNNGVIVDISYLSDCFKNWLNGTVNFFVNHE